MRVAVKTSQAHGLSMSRQLRLHRREIEVVEVLDQWFGPDCRYCKVEGSDRALYILRGHCHVNAGLVRTDRIAFAYGQAFISTPPLSAHRHPASRLALSYRDVEDMLAVAASMCPTRRSAAGH